MVGRTLEPTPEELLENAHVLLDEVDDAPIFKTETGNREFPSFARKGTIFARLTFDAHVLCIY